ncbi:MAG: thiamine diphosphokinase [Pseudomonadota bacterium]|jgi:thiamine pyrophosphokinase
MERSSVTACICCNGEIGDTAGAKSLAGGADLLIAADGGAVHLADMGLIPHVIIGDMDSITHDMFADYENIRRIPFPRDKDLSDSELSVQWAIEHEAKRILMLGALGGRPDHAFGNVIILKRFPGLVGLWDDGYLHLSLSSGQDLTLQTLPGAVISLFPLDDDTRIRTTGLQYELMDDKLKYATQGLSNTTESGNFSVTVTRGQIILFAEGGQVWFHQ